MIDEIFPPRRQPSILSSRDLMSSLNMSIYAMGRALITARELELDDLRDHLFIRLERELRVTGPWPASALRYLRKLIVYWGPVPGFRGRRRRANAWHRFTRALNAFDHERATAVLTKVVIEQPKRRVELERRMQGLGEPVAACKPDEGGGDPAYDLCAICQRPVEGFDHAKCEAFFDKLGGRV